MKETLLKILEEYLKVFPEEKERQEEYRKYLEKAKGDEVADWNNFKGHTVATGFIYNKETKKFLVVHHRDLDMYLSPGGHVDIEDGDPLNTAKREVKEETGLDNLEYINANENNLVPLDIDTHTIEYNKRKNLPEHRHFDHRYLFEISKTTEIKIAEEELSEYQWVEIDKLMRNPAYKIIVNKLKKLI